MSEKKNLKEDIIYRKIKETADFLDDSIQSLDDSTQSKIAYNPYAGIFYQGLNAKFLRFNTLINGYSSNAYLTFNNVKELGGYVKKGEKAQVLIKNQSQLHCDLEIQIKLFSVFNLDQCEIDYQKLKEHQIKKDLLPFIKTLEENPMEEKEIQTIEIVETILKNSKIPIKKIQEVILLGTQIYI